jgi:RNA-binding protein NOB1
MSTWASLLRNSAPVGTAECATSVSCRFPLILDANALIRGDINYIRGLGADDVITLPAILAEVRDRVSREMLASWPVKPHEMNPDAASIEFVEAFAKLTGDITTLSRQDVRVLALAVMLERRINGGSNLRDKPQVNVLKRKPTSESEAVAAGGGGAAAVAVGADEDWSEAVDDEEGAHSGESDEGSGSCSEDEGDQDDGEAELALLNSELAALDATSCSDNIASVPSLCDEQNADDGGEWEVVTRKRDQGFAHRDSSSKATVLPGWYNGDDEEAGWIGPSSAISHTVGAAPPTIDSHFQSVAHEVESVSIVDATAPCSDAAPLPTSPCVRVVTADFAMQNVLLQMGIKVVGTGGKMVRAVKTFVLKCHACFKICMDATREFCPHCGNHTMMKVKCCVGERIYSFSATMFHLYTYFCDI